MTNFKEMYYKYKVFLVPVLAGIISLLVTVFIIFPQTMEYFKQKDKLAELMGRIGILNSKAEELGNIDSETRKKDLAITLTVLPTDKNVPQSMSVLQDLINKSNLVLKSTTYSPSSRGSGKNGFALTVSVVGSLTSIKNFMSELQSAARIFKVESAILTFQGAGSLIEADIPLTVYYEPVPKTLINLDASVPKINSDDEELINNLSKSITQFDTITSTGSSVPVGKTDPFE